MKRLAILIILIFLLPGTARAVKRLDLNEDGQVNIMDLLAFLAHLTGQEPIEDAEKDYVIFTYSGQDTILANNYIGPRNLSEVAPFDSLYDLPNGTQMVIRTVWQGTQPQDFLVKYRGIVDVINSSFPMIFLEASDPRLVQLGGGAAGMSGSPVVYNGKIVGAVSWSFSEQAHPPYYFFATAIEDMIDPPYAIPALASAGTLEYRGSRLVPVGLSMMSNGFSSILSRKLEERYPDLNLSFSDHTAAGLTDITPELIPGGSLGVSLVIGDEVNATGVGTISFVDGDKLYAFGHSMEQYGETELPFVAVEINGIISGLESAFKIGRVGNEALGTIDYDGFPCIIGEIGRQPDLFNTVLVANLPNGELLNQQHRVAKVGLSDSEKYLYSAIALFSPLLNRLDNNRGYSVRMRTRIQFNVGGLQEINRTGIFADPNMGILELLLEGVNDYLIMGDELTFQQFIDPTPELVEIEIETVDSLLSAVITDIEIDSTIAPGKRAVGVVKMIVARNQEKEVGITLDIPVNFPQGYYFLTVAPLAYFFEGSPMPGIDGIIDRLNRGLRNTRFSARLEGYDFEELSVDSEDLGLVLSGEVVKEIIIER